MCKPEASSRWARQPSREGDKLYVFLITYTFVKKGVRVGTGDRGGGGRYPILLILAAFPTLKVRQTYHGYSEQIINY